MYFGQCFDFIVDFFKFIYDVINKICNQDTIIKRIGTDIK